MTTHLRAENLDKDHLDKTVVVDDYEGVTHVGRLWGIDLRIHPNRIVLHLTGEHGSRFSREIFVNHDTVVAVD